MLCALHGETTREKAAVNAGSALGAVDSVFAGLGRIVQVLGTALTTSVTDTMCWIFRGGRCSAGVVVGRAYPPTRAQHFAKGVAGAQGGRLVVWISLQGAASQDGAFAQSEHCRLLVALAPYTYTGLRQNSS